MKLMHETYGSLLDIVYVCSFVISINEYIKKDDSLLVESGSILFSLCTLSNYRTKRTVGSFAWWNTH